MLYHIHHRLQLSKSQKHFSHPPTGHFVKLDSQSFRSSSLTRAKPSALSTNEYSLISTETKRIYQQGARNNVLLPSKHHSHFSCEGSSPYGWPNIYRCHYKHLPCLTLTRWTNPVNAIKRAQSFLQFIYFLLENIMTITATIPHRQTFSEVWQRQ